MRTAANRACCHCRSRDASSANGYSSSSRLPGRWSPGTAWRTEPCVISERTSPLHSARGGCGACSPWKMPRTEPTATRMPRVDRPAYDRIPQTVVRIDPPPRASAELRLADYLKMNDVGCAGLFVVEFAVADACRSRRSDRAHRRWQGTDTARPPCRTAPVVAAGASSASRSPVPVRRIAEIAICAAA